LFAVEQRVREKDFIPENFTLRRKGGKGVLRREE
jgi:hypothetical protein